MSRHGRVAIGVVAAVLLLTLFAVPGARLTYASPGVNAKVSADPCHGPTSHVPDGPDGTGTCWPGPNNTGPNAAQSTMAPYTGPCAINTPNVTIDSKVITCSIRVGPNASGLVISNSYILGGASVDQTSGSTASFTVRDSYMDGTQSNGYACAPCGIGGHNVTLLRNEITSTNRGVWCESHCTIRDNYIHTAANLDPARGDHASGLRLQQYGTVIHNTIGCRYTGPFSGPGVNSDTGCSADITGYPDFAPLHHNTVEDNLLLANAGNAYCVYAGGTREKPYSNDPANATYVVFRNNVFQRGSTNKCAAYGPITDFETAHAGNQWINNTWDDGRLITADGETGRLAPPRDTDGDGLTDPMELRRYQTDPRRPDTDRDGLTDRDEVRRYRTNPLKQDTDGDHLRDGAEVKRYKTSPRRADTDRDGLTDGDEVRRYHTDPRKKDTDGDGQPDGAEVRSGTNPRVRE